MVPPSLERVKTLGGQSKNLRKALLLPQPSGFLFTYLKTITLLILCRNYSASNIFYNFEYHMV